jgi:exosome complex RNA-binding protein Rrp42 (RNase PH superfamily)
MYEELLLDPKTTIKTNNNKIFIEKTEQIQFQEKQFLSLINLALKNDISVVEELFKQIKV